MSALRYLLGPGKFGFLRVLLPALVIAGLVTGGRVDQASDFPTVQGCATDVSHPIQLQVSRLGDLRPGAVVTARVDVTSSIHLDEVTVRVKSPADVRLLSTPAADLGLVRAGEARSHTFSLVAPRGNSRRTVEILVEGRQDGVLISRGAVLNLSFEDEPSRIVTTPDGRRVREVRARKIG